MNGKCKECYQASQYHFLNDAKNLEDKIKAQSATLYKPQNIHYSLLTDQEATKTNITGKPNELSRIIKPHDSFIIFVAGHGVLLKNQYYMLTHDYDGTIREKNTIAPMLSLRCRRR